MGCDSGKKQSRKFLRFSLLAGFVSVSVYVAVRDRSQSRRRVGFLRDGLDRAYPCWTRAWLLEIAARRSINQRAAERFFGFFWGVSARDGAPCDVLYE